MGWEAQTGGLTSARYKLGTPACGEWRAALRREYEWRPRFLFALQFPQCPHFVTLDWMRARGAAA